MNTYIFYRRIRWPIILLTFGVTALLDQWGVIRFHQSWPLYLIVLGVLRLAEGAALAAQPVPPSPSAQSVWSGTPPAGPSYAAGSSPAPIPSPGTELIRSPQTSVAPFPPSIDEES